MEWLHMRGAKLIPLLSRPVAETLGLPQSLQSSTVASPNSRNARAVKKVSAMDHQTRMSKSVRKGLAF